MKSIVHDLRARIAHLGAAPPRLRRVLPFGLSGLDGHLPGGGLALGAVHEVAGRNGGADGAAAALFAAGIAARTRGSILWCMTAADLFAPALAHAGLHADRVIYVEAHDTRTVLGCMEEGLRHGGLGAVVAEISRLSMSTSRRLQLAAESASSIGIILRRWQHQQDVAELQQPTAAMTRWRISVLPSSPLPVPGIGRARWRVELVHVRASEGTTLELEACDGSGRLAVPADLVDRSGPQEIGGRSASA